MHIKGLVIKAHVFKHDLRVRLERSAFLDIFFSSLHHVDSSCTTTLIVEILLAQFKKLSQITKSQHRGDCSQFEQQRDTSSLGLVPWNGSKTHNPFSEREHPVVYVK